MSFLVKNGEPKSIPENWIKTPYACPVCKHLLYYIADRAGATVWCPWGDCSSIGMNEGGHGSTLEKAMTVLLGKNGFAKYEYEAVETPEPTDESGTAVKPEGKKRGRKKKGAKDEPMTIPIGEFTIKDFCTVNNTYPVKAQKYIESVKTVKKVGPRSSGRGKPAMVYINKV